jgi:NAD(P)H-nitrite reductase large subunit
MKPDDELCLCFHVSWRKVINYVRVEKVTLPSQVSQCFGAGTGCGWCRPFLNRLVQQVNENPPSPATIEQWMADKSPRKDRYETGRNAHRTAANDSSKQATESNAEPESISPEQDGTEANKNAD